MMCKSVSFICCIFLAVVIANVYSKPYLSTGSNLHDKVKRLPTENRKSTAEKGLGALLDARDNAMVFLAAGDTRLLAHRAVLAARSPVFAAVLQANSSYISIADMEGPVLRQLVALLYTPEQCQQPAMSPQLQAAAHRFGVSMLKAECSQQAAIPLSVETAAATAVVAIRHSCDSLGQTALAFIKGRIAQVMASQGWADAVYKWHEEVIEVTRMLFDVPADSSTPATGDCRTSPITQPPSHHTVHDQTPSTAAPSVTRSASPPSDSVASSALSTPATGDSRTRPTTQPPSRHTDHGQTPSTAAPSVTCGASPPPDSAAISALRSLSAEEKASRLIAAAKRGSVAEVAALLSAGADVGAVDGDRKTALHWAARVGHLEVARCLLGAGANVGARTSGKWTPLHEAVYNGSPSMVRLLLAASADPDVRAVDGRSPLHNAAWWGRTEAAAALLEAGANRGVRGNDGLTPLDLARVRKNQQIVDLLS